MQLVYFDHQTIGHVEILCIYLLYLLMNLCIKVFVSYNLNCMLEIVFTLPE